MHLRNRTRVFLSFLLSFYFACSEAHYTVFIEAAGVRENHEYFINGFYIERHFFRIPQEFGVSRDAENLLAALVGRSKKGADHE